MHIRSGECTTYAVLDRHTDEAIVVIADYSSEVCISLVLAIATIVYPKQH